MTTPQLEKREPIQNYQVFENLGSGATSDVYRVKNKKNGRFFVLKKMSLENMTDEEQLRAKQEITVMDDVDHPNVVKFRESFSDNEDKSVHIIMEYCEFGTLEQLIERQRYEGRPFPTDVLLEWMAELLCGLAHIHSKRILHRDLKSSNIFVTSKNHLKLGDFGVCTILSNPNAKAESMIGTPLYFAPEVCENEAYDERSDVWSLGVVFYEMCTLRRPFEASNLFSLIQDILTTEVKPFGNSVPGMVEGLVQQMLSKDPRERPTAQELIDVHLEVPLSHPSHPSQKPSSSRALQKFRGPELYFSKPWPPPNGAEPAKPLQSTEAAKTSEWIYTGSALDLFVELQRTTHGIPHLEKAKRQPKKESTSSPVVTPPPHHIVSVTKGKPEKMLKRRATAKASSSSACQSCTREHKSGSKASRSQEDSGIKSAALSFTIRDLQQDVLRKRNEMFGDGDMIQFDDAPIVIERESSLLELYTSVRSSRCDSSGRATFDDSSTRVNSSFLADIATVMDRHTASGRSLSLESLDGAVRLLSQYKRNHYGSP